MCPLFAALTGLLAEHGCKVGGVRSDPTVAVTFDTGENEREK